MAKIRLLRVKHWIKNLFLFIPAFFAEELFSLNNLIILFQGFIAFSFMASAIYIVNDYKDIENDRLHPEKKDRPLASSEVSLKSAFILFILLILSSFTIGYFLNFKFFCILLFYFIFNIAYTFGLKNIAILDILIVASGFLLRTVAGAIIISVPVSQWLIIMVFLLAIFLALAKRRDDILVMHSSGMVIRKSIKHYNLDFVNACLTMLSSVILVAYIMYTISEDVTTRLNSDSVYITSIFVMAGIMRYLQIVLVEKNSGSPTKILYSDLFLRITLIGWIVSFYIIIYLHKL